MKLLRLTVKGLPLFKEKLDLIFYAQQRVCDEDKENLYSLFSNIYLNPANAFIGINASGKTSVLKVIVLALGILNNEPINHIDTKEILGQSEQVIFNMYFYAESTKEICRLETLITSTQSKTEGTLYKIVSESLYTKTIQEIASRKGMLDFHKKEPVMIRNDKEMFLLDDVSIMVAKNKKTGEQIHAINLLRFTNINILPFSGNVPKELIAYLDPTIEYLHSERKSDKVIYHLKFKGKDEIILNSPYELNTYLSSGTIKGMITFVLAQEALKDGSYLIIDEIENHFNKEIVSTLMRFFMDSEFNKKGGMLIFSTHYPELLEEYDRNDSIYITRNTNGVTATNLNQILKRNDIKKSDAYQSGLLQGTTPSYETYMQLKKSIAKSLL